MLFWWILLSMFYVPTHQISDINCLRRNPGILDAGLHHFFYKSWDWLVGKEEVDLTVELISTRFKRVHKTAVTPISSGAHLYANSTHSSPPLLLTPPFDDANDLDKTVRNLQLYNSQAHTINSRYKRDVITGLHLHDFRKNITVLWRALHIFLGWNHLSTPIPLGHLSMNCSGDFENLHILRYLRKLQFITCKVRPSKRPTPEASAVKVIEKCDTLRDKVKSINPTAEFMCMTEYYSEGTLEISGVTGSLVDFQRFWCRIIKELVKNESHAGIIMWSAFDFFTYNSALDRVWLDKGEAQYHTGWWRWSTDDVKFLEKVDDLTGRKKKTKEECMGNCELCTSSEDCCSGMLCSATSGFKQQGPPSHPMCHSRNSTCGTNQIPPTDIQKTTEHTILRFESGESSFNSRTIVLFSVITVSAVFLSSFFAFFFYRKITANHVLTREELRGFFQGVDPSKRGQSEDNLPAHKIVEDLPYDTGLEIDKSHFEIYEGQILGSGSFGVVVRGRVRGEDVAVKTTLPGIEKQLLKVLMNEMKVLMHLGKHEHIVNLKGSYTAELMKGKLYLFLELCSLGNVLDLLRSHRDSFTRKGRTSQENPEEAAESIFTCKDLLKWSVQIASGMEYLVEKRVIHGDIAARNILVFSLDKVKLTDFGLSRRLFEYTNCVKNGQESLPWRHMSVEALRDLSFSVQSDVWAFGVTIWEIFSLGEVPFAKHTWSRDFVELLITGLRLPQTTHAHPLIYEVMASCWTLDVNSRPSITLIHSALCSTLDELYDSPEYIRP